MKYFTGLNIKTGPNNFLDAVSSPVSGSASAWGNPTEVLVSDDINSAAAFPTGNLRERNLQLVSDGVPISGNMAPGNLISGTPTYTSYLTQGLFTPEQVNGNSFGISYSVEDGSGNYSDDLIVTELSAQNVGDNAFIRYILVEIKQFAFSFFGTNEVRVDHVRLTFGQTLGNAIGTNPPETRFELRGFTPSRLGIIH